MIWDGIVKKQITIGVLAGAMCFTLILWSLSYLQEKVNAYTEYSLPEYY